MKNYSMYGKNSKPVAKDQCPRCALNGNDNSRDNLVVYDDGHGYCFACGYLEQEKQNMNTEFENLSPIGDYDPTPTTTNKTDSRFISPGEISPLPHRKLREETCSLFGYTTNGSNEVEPFLDTNGKLKAQHIRTTNPKGFYWKGDTNNLPFFGQNLFSRGPRICITEGAIDCMTISQVFGNKYPVVSIPNGVNSAVSSVKDNYEFLSKFELIVICFDMDEPGQEAARAIADVLPPGKVRIMSTPGKDANETLVEHGAEALVKAYWNAKPYSPDCILPISVVLETTEETHELYEYPWESLTRFTVGQDDGRLTLWTASPGQGKSSVIRELIVHHLQVGNTVGCVFLEESPEQTAIDLVSLLINKPVKEITSLRQLNGLRQKYDKDPIYSDINDNLTADELAAGKAELSSYPLYIYNHLGRAGVTNILGRLEYMAVALGCKVLIIDHITLLGNMILSNADNEGMTDERLILDDIMRQLRSIVERTGVLVHVVAHIKKTDKDTDGGARLSLNDLRGSGSLAQISDNVIALERDRQNPDELVANTTIVRVLKNRRSGKCGIASALFFDRTSARLRDIPFAVQENGEVLFDHDETKGNTRL